MIPHQFDDATVALIIAILAERAKRSLPRPQKDLRGRQPFESRTPVMFRVWHCGFVLILPARLIPDRQDKCNWLR